LLNFETLIARGSLTEGFGVTHSTLPVRAGEQIFALEGFSDRAPRICFRAAAGPDSRCCCCWNSFAPCKRGRALLDC
jgi:hypothetical protein